MTGGGGDAGEAPARAPLKRAADWVARDDPARPGQWLGRFVILRLLGIVYLMAFLTLVNQGPGLIGPHGLEPAAGLLDDAAAQFGSRGAGFWNMPTLFWLLGG